MAYNCSRNALTDQADARRAANATFQRREDRLATLERRIAELEAWELKVRQADERLDV